MKVARINRSVGRRRTAADAGPSRQPSSTARCRLRGGDDPRDRILLRLGQHARRGSAIQVSLSSVMRVRGVGLRLSAPAPDSSGLESAQSSASASRFALTLACSASNWLFSPAKIALIWVFCASVRFELVQHEAHRRRRRDDRCQCGPPADGAGGAGRRRSGSRRIDGHCRRARPRGIVRESLFVA